MSRPIVNFFTAVALVAFPCLLGCDGAPGSKGAAAHKDEKHEDEKHEGEHPEGEHHEGDGHDDHAASGHPEEGPHHGHLIELGEEEYHAELTHDDATKTVTIYLLDKTAKTAVPIADAELLLNLVADGKPLQVKLAATPLDTDPAGQASRFTLVDETVLESLEAPQTTGRLNVTIGGKSYSGVVEHQEHGDHEH